MADIHTTEFRVALTTCPDREQAETIARALVEARAAACVNLLPGAVSIYRWEGKIETAGEVLLIIKTSASQVDSVREIVSRLHSYAVPEFLVLEVSSGSQEYLDFLSGALK